MHLAIQCSRISFFAAEIQIHALGVFMRGAAFVATAGSISTPSGQAAQLNVCEIEVTSDTEVSIHAQVGNDEVALMVSEVILVVRPRWERRSSAMLGQSLLRAMAHFRDFLAIISKSHKAKGMYRKIYLLSSQVADPHQY